MKEELRERLQKLVKNMKNLGFTFVISNTNEINVIKLGVNSPKEDGRLSALSTKLMNINISMDTDIESSIKYLEEIMKDYLSYKNLLNLRNEFINLFK